MLFQTNEFLILLLCVIVGLTLLRNATQQHVMLLLTGYIFYGWWDVRFLVLLLLSTILDYTNSLAVAGVRLRGRQLLLVNGITILGILLFLGLNWPTWQGLQSGVDPGTLLARWNGVGMAILLALACVAIFNLLYQLAFRLEEDARRRAFLLLSLTGNLGMLCSFKYYNFFMDNLIGLQKLFGLDWHPTFLHVALPVGISFYTFQSLSYTLDVYRRDVPAETSLLRYALFVTYFPQLVAGPILRPHHFLPHLDKPWTITEGNFVRGLHLSLVGLFKKVIIADNISPLVDSILTQPTDYPSIIIVAATALFAVQIYCDFSGYTDIARGVSRLFGIEIPLNFNYPYFSTSIIEFWRRWHISLSSWLRDYLYIPLGGGRGSAGRVYANLMTTMVIGGLWHGASWNFVIWGAYQGALLCINRLFRALCDQWQALDRIMKTRAAVLVSWVITLYLTLLGWLIFRVTDFEALKYCLKKFLVFDGVLSVSQFGLGRGDPANALLALILFGFCHAWAWFVRPWDEALNRLSPQFVAAAYVAFTAFLFVCWPSGEQSFIYFQF
jgi:alginate O-acetyltransferase complex protein AlgI